MMTVVLKLQGSKTTLHYACESGSTEIVKLLIERGADVDKEDNVYKFLNVLSAYDDNFIMFVV